MRFSTIIHALAAFGAALGETEVWNGTLDDDAFCESLTSTLQGNSALQTAPDELRVGIGHENRKKGSGNDSGNGRKHIGKRKLSSKTGKRKVPMSKKSKRSKRSKPTSYTYSYYNNVDEMEQHSPKPYNSPTVPTTTPVINSIPSTIANAPTDEPFANNLSSTVTSMDGSSAIPPTATSQL